MKAWFLLLGASMYKRRGAVLFSLLLAIGTVAAGVGLLGVAGWFLTSAFLATIGVVFNLFGPSALIRGLSFWRIASRYLERVVGHALTLDLQVRIRSLVFGRLSCFSQPRLAQFRDGELAASLISDVDVLDLVLLLLLVPLATAVVAGLVFSFVLQTWLSWWAWLILACLLIAACLIPYLCAQRASHASQQVHLLENRKRVLVHQVIRAYADVQVFDGVGAVQEQVNTLSQELGQARLRSNGWGIIGQFGQQVFMGVSLLTCLLVGARLTNLGVLSGSVWVGLVLALLGLFEIMAPMMRGASRLGEVQAASDRLVTILSEPVDSEQERGLVIAQDRPALLEVCDLSFAYGTQPVMNQVSLQILRGEHIAIYGPSGSGKSTLLSILMRLLPVAGHHYQVDGKDADAWSRASWFEHCALLAQDSPLFLGTVRDNLLLADPAASEQHLWQVLYDAQLDDVVRNLPQGLDTWLGEGGQQLSLGQQRRLCLARVLLSHACIWFLDEPTASLDGLTSQALMRDILTAADGKTVIMATHDTRLLSLVDRVYQFNSGQLLSYSGPS